MAIQHTDQYVHFQMVLRLGSQDSYVISGVDEAEFYGVTDKIEIKVKKEPPRSYDDNVPNSKLTRKTDKLCPDCGNALYNTKLDGLYFYCPKCKKQHHI